MKNIFLGILVFLFFVALTIIVTYPLPRYMANSLTEPGDSLLNTWVITQGIQKLLSDPINLFHANIFYPYKYTLAYTENMLGNALLAMPVYLATNKPILVYNFVFLATFIIGGFGMFLLIRYLTKSPLAGIIGGIVFVFTPYRFHILGHLHVLSIHWLPFTLLFLHKYFDFRKSKYLFLFCIFFLLQGATSGHIGLYQVFVVTLFLFFVLISAGSFRLKDWIKLGIGLGVTGVLLLPLYLPYMHLAKALNFMRSEEELIFYSASIENFNNIVFPGGLVIALAVLGIFHKRDGSRSCPRFIIMFINIIALLSLAVIIYVVFFGRFDLGVSVFGTRLKVADLENPFIILISSLIARHILLKKSFISNRFYFSLAILSFLFCLGPKIELSDTFTGPYVLLYDYFPGFKGLRVPFRWAVVFMFATAVLSGLGWKKIERIGWGKWIVLPIVLVVLLKGYVTAPFPIRFKVFEKPGVYEWLEKQPNDAVIIELPMPDGYSSFYREAVYMYWSLFHKKRMVNGYSGYSSPTYWHIVELMRSFPSSDSLHLLRYLGIEYIIVHNGMQKEKIETFKNDLKLKYKDGTDYVYELTGKYKPPALKKDTLVSVERSLFNGSSNYNSELVGYAYDSSMNTRWNTGKKQIPGMWFKVDLGKEERIRRVVLYLGRYQDDYPRGVKLEVSRNGIKWDEVVLGNCYSNFIIDSIETSSCSVMELNFVPVEARYIKLTVTEEHPLFYWSIYEIEIDKVS